jgi:uncharacterized protein (DUF885 family)
MALIVVFAGASFDSQTQSVKNDIESVSFLEAFQSDSSSSNEDSHAVIPARLTASEFQHQKQITPAYEVVVEFLAEDLSAKHFIYVKTIPDVQPWYERSVFVANKMLISGWKTTRTLISKSTHNFSLL